MYRVYFVDYMGLWDNPIETFDTKDECITYLVYAYDTLSIGEDLLVQYNDEEIIEAGNMLPYCYWG